MNRNSSFNVLLAFPFTYRTFQSSFSSSCRFLKLSRPHFDHFLSSGIVVQPTCLQIQMTHLSGNSDHTTSSTITATKKGNKPNQTNVFSIRKPKLASTGVIRPQSLLEHRQVRDFHTHAFPVLRESGCPPLPRSSVPL